MSLIRIGQGWDVHRIAPGRPLILGGVTIPSEFGFEGHLRLSYCGTIRDITEGLDRIKWALDPNSSNELYLGDRKLVRDWQ